MKTCARCKQSKPQSEFNRASSAKDGLQSWCRRCKADFALAKYHTDPDRKQKGREKMRRLRREQPDRMRTYIRGWRRRNADRVRARDAARRATPERRAWQAAYWREWKLRHPEQARLIARRGQANRRARRAAAFIETVDPLIVFDRSQGLCGICGDDVDVERFDVDHIVPLAIGGEHSYANTQAAHPSCNYSKGARLQVVAA